MVGKNAKDLNAIKQPERGPRRRKLGCWIVILLVAALLIAAVRDISKDNAEWERLRPATTTKESWEALRDQCRAVNLDVAECASTPKKKIEHLVAAQSAAEQADLCAREDRGNARREAEKAVRASLKSPSTADFGGDPRIRHDGCRWVISGDVDAQNGFGAMLRSNYRVELLRIGEDLWAPVTVRINE